MNTVASFRISVSVVAFLVAVGLLTGCAQEYEPVWHGQGRLTMEGALEEQVECEAHFVPKGHAGGGTGDYRYDSPTVYFGDKSDPRVGLEFIMWQREDGTSPDIEPYSYPVIFDRFDLAQPRTTGVFVNMTTNQKWFRSLGDSGSVVIDSMDNHHISGSIDVTLADSQAEPHQTIHLTGNFDATRQERD